MYALVFPGLGVQGGTVTGDEGAERLTKKPEESDLDWEDEKSQMGFQRGRGVASSVFVVSGTD